jgi:PAS domain S-box-containing protein
MTLDEFVRIFAERSTTSIVVTDAALDNPGPVIRYVNPAFCRMTGYAAEDLVGRSPRMLQGRDTQVLTVRTLSRALRNGSRFHGVLANYRKSGEAYLCEIDVRPIHSRQGLLEGFIAFEREVVRPRGRPREEDFGRFRPLLPEDPIFDAEMGSLSPFAP